MVEDDQDCIRCQHPMSQHEFEDDSDDNGDTEHKTRGACEVASVPDLARRGDPVAAGGTMAWRGRFGYHDLTFLTLVRPESPARLVRLV